MVRSSSCADTALHSSPPVSLQKEKVLGSAAALSEVCPSCIYSWLCNMAFFPDFSVPNLLLFLKLASRASSGRLGFPASLGAAGDERS